MSELTKNSEHKATHRFYLKGYERATFFRKVVGDDNLNVSAKDMELVRDDRISIPRIDVEKHSQLKGKQEEHIQPAIDEFKTNDDWDYDGDWGIGVTAHSHYWIRCDA